MRTLKVVSREVTENDREAKKKVSIIYFFPFTSKCIFTTLEAINEQKKVRSHYDR
ncbi:hypothetical protein [Myxosarcina sp. GI1(2024)]